MSPLRLPTPTPAPPPYSRLEKAELHKVLVWSILNTEREYESMIWFLETWSQCMGLSWSLLRLCLQELSGGLGCTLTVLPEVLASLPIPW